MGSFRTLCAAAALVLLEAASSFAFASPTAPYGSSSVEERVVNQVLMDLRASVSSPSLETIDVAIEWLGEAPPGDAGITKITFDKFRRQVTVLTATPEGSGSYIGRVTALIDVAVPIHTIPRGTILSEQDVDWKRIDGLTAHKEALTSLDAAVGKEAKRLLSANKPILKRDLGEAVVVPRNSHVEILYTSDGLTITGSGKAIDAGSIGQSIRVQNTDSRRIIAADVIGPGQVEIRR